MRLIRSLTLAGSFVVAIPCGAAQGLPEAFSACRAVQDDSARLACYDREADRLTEATAPATASADTAPDATAPDATAPDATDAGAAAAPAGTSPGAATHEERFGYRGGVLQRAESDRVKEEEMKAIPELLATAKAVSERPDGTLVVTLDNGQVWAQKAPQRSFKVEVGEQVKIEPGFLGAFLMSAGASKRTTRVTRLR